MTFDRTPIGRGDRHGSRQQGAEDSWLRTDPEWAAP